jgi:peptidyl-prolyl cis-trans isomerase C
MKNTNQLIVAAVGILTLGISLPIVSQDSKPADTPPAPAAPGAAPAAAAPAAEPTNSIVLTIDGTAIMENDVREMMISRYGRQLQQMPPEQLAMVQQQMQQMILTDLISKTLLLNAAEKEGYKATDEDVAKEIEEISKRIPEGQSFEEFAKSAGVDIKRIKEQIADDTKIRKLIDVVTKDVEKPGEEKVKKYYDEHPDEFSQKEMVAASHILLSTQEASDENAIAAVKAEADKLKEQLGKEDGKTFEELATAHSDCPSKAQGGSLGEFGRGQMVPEFEKAAFTQKIGEVGAPIKTQFGYHLIKVTDKKEAKTTPYAEVQEELASSLFEQAKGKEVQSYLTQLRSNANIVNPNQPVTPPGQSLLPPNAQEPLPNKAPQQ